MRRSIPAFDDLPRTWTGHRYPACVIAVASSRIIVHLRAGIPFEVIHAGRPTHSAGGIGHGGIDWIVDDDCVGVTVVVFMKPGVIQVGIRCCRREQTIPNVGELGVRVDWLQIVAYIGN